MIWTRVAFDFKILVFVLLVERVETERERERVCRICRRSEWVFSSGRHDESDVKKGGRIEKLFSVSEAIVHQGSGPYTYK